MKGEEVPPYSRWGGNPAEELRDDEPRRPLAAPRSGAGKAGPEPADDGAPALPPPVVLAPRGPGRHRAHQRHLAPAHR
jgi:hypothetical protein